MKLTKIDKETLRSLLRCSSLITFNPGTAKSLKKLAKHGMADEHAGFEKRYSITDAGRAAMADIRRCAELEAKA